jgi:trk system potassium uptake protein
MRLRKIFPYMSVLLRFNALILLMPVPVALHYGEPISLFLIAAVASYALGSSLSPFKYSPIDLGDAMLLTIASLVTTSLLSSIVFMGALDDALPERIVNSFFESVSGYTTTGLSIIDSSRIEQYPKSIMFLRAASQWIGGVGIILLFMCIGSYRDFNMAAVYNVERSGQKLTPSSISSAREIMKIYCLFTLAGFVFLYICGMDTYSSLYNVMCSISTGGFWYTNSAPYNNVFAELVTIGLMVFGSMGFFIHYSLMQGQLKEVLRNLEVRWMAAIIAVGIAVFVVVFLGEGKSMQQSLDDAVFNVVSAATTTGYATIDFSKVGDFGKFATSILMVIGTGANSTGGGIKIIRFVIMVYSVAWVLKKIILPKTAVVPFKIAGVVVEDYDTERVYIHAIAHIFILVLGALVITAYGHSAIDSIFVSASAIGTVGLSTLPLHDIAMPIKLLLTIEMLIGRVETMPVLILLAYAINRIRNRTV